MPKRAQTSNQDRSGTDQRPLATTTSEETPISRTSPAGCLVARLKKLPEILNDSDEEWMRHFARWVPHLFKNPAPHAKAGRLFTGMNIQDVQALQERAGVRDDEFKSQSPLNRDLIGYFLIRPQDDTEPNLILQELERSAYFDYLRFETTITFPGEAIDVNCMGKHGYGQLELGPEGISARYAWNFPGGAGAGLRLVDVEGGWILEHEDLRELGITHASPVSCLISRLCGQLPSSATTMTNVAPMQF